MPGWGANLQLREFLVNDGVTSLSPIGEQVESIAGSTFLYVLNDSGAASVVGRLAVQKAGARYGNVTQLAANAAIINSNNTSVVIGAFVAAVPPNAFCWVQIKGPNLMPMPTSAVIAIGDGLNVGGGVTPNFLTEVGQINDTGLWHGIANRASVGNVLLPGFADLWCFGC